MKKIITIFILSLFLLSQFQVVMANPFTTRLTSTATNIEVGQNFTVTVEVRGSAGIFGLTADLNFDTSKLEVVESTAQSGFALTLGSRIVVDHTNLQQGNFNIARITFRARPGFVVGESTSITVSNVVALGESNEVSGSDSSITINLVPPKSTNNFLSLLETNVGRINFNRNTLNYTLIVDNNVTTANITGTLEDPRATVSGLGNKTLGVYSNVFNITVTAENGSIRRYSLNIVRRDASGNAGALSTNNALRSITLDVCTVNFSPDVVDYSCEVDNLVNAFVLDSEVADARSSVKQEGPATLVFGPNVITLTVTAESGDVRVYTITITRSSSAPTVSIDRLEEVLKTLESDQIAILAPEDGVIDQSVLSLIRHARKNLIIRVVDLQGRTRYEWHIDGSRVNPAQSINTTINFSIRHEVINEQTNYAHGLVLHFNENASLPQGTKIKFYLDESLSTYSMFNLYYFNADTQLLELREEGLEVEENFVWIPVEHTSQYFLTPANLQMQTSESPISNTYVFWLILSGVQLIVIVVLGVLLRKKNRILT